MKIHDKFHKRAANLIEVVGDGPTILSGPQYPLGIQATFYAPHDSDKGQLAIHMTPHEALEFAANLINAARQQLLYEAKRASHKQATTSTPTKEAT